MIDPYGLAYVYGFGGTFYNWNTFGGGEESNLTNPMPKVNEGNNNLFNNLNNTFDPGSILGMGLSGWGGANRDFTPEGLKALMDQGKIDPNYARMDNIYNNKIVDDFIKNYNNYVDIYKSDIAVITALSHGNQVAKEMIGQLAERGFDLSKVTYVAYSHPNRADHPLDSKIAQQLGAYLNIYNIYDKVAGKDCWAKIDTIEPGKGLLEFNKLDGLYQKDAINFAIEGNEKVFIKSHTETLKNENIVKGVLDLYTSLKDQLKPGDTIIVKIDEDGNVIGYRIVRGGGSGTNCSDRAPGRVPGSNQNNPADTSFGGGGGGDNKAGFGIFGDKTTPRTKKPEMMERSFNEELEKNINPLSFNRL